MAETWHDRIQRFKLFGTIGEEGDRVQLVNYMQELIEGKAAEETESTSNKKKDKLSEQAEIYKGVIDDIVLTPGLLPMMRKHEALKGQVITDVLSFLESVTIEQVQQQKKKRFRLPFSLGGKKSKKKGQGGKGNSLQDKMSQLSQQLSDMFSSDKEKKKSIKRMGKKMMEKAQKTEKVKVLLDSLQHGFSPMWGKFEGTWQKSTPDIMDKYEELLKNDKSIRELADLLGKYRKSELEGEQETLKSISIKPFRKTLSKGKEQLVGVRESDDLAHLLPSEVSLLGEDETSYIFYKKLAEKKLQTFELKGAFNDHQIKEGEKQKQKASDSPKGPIIICVDTSASMMGKPEQVAKVLCFALLKKALKDKRKCYLISFSKQIQTMEIHNMPNSVNMLLDFLTMSFKGGTDVAPALTNAIEKIHEEDFVKADILMISDGKIPELDTMIKHKIRTAQMKNNRFFHLMIANRSAKGSIKEFDANWFYNPTSRKSMKEIVEHLKKLD